MKKRKLLLDVGCGEARCCINFAKDGYDVIGIEKNLAVFEKAKINVSTSAEKKFIKLYNQDIREIKLNQKFDGILCNFVLMFMSKKDFLKLLENFYTKLNAKGELLIKLLMSDDPIAIASKQKEDVFFPSYAELREIQKQYRGILEFKLLRDEAHNSLDFPHIHSVGILKIVK